MGKNVGPVRYACRECAGQEVNPAAVSVQTASCSNRKKAVDFREGRTPKPLDFLITKGPRQWSYALDKSILGSEL